MKIVLKGERTTKTTQPVVVQRVTSNSRSDSSSGGGGGNSNEAEGGEASPPPGCQCHPHDTPSDCPPCGAPNCLAINWWLYWSEDMPPFTTTTTTGGEEGGGGGGSDISQDLLTFLRGQWTDHLGGHQQTN